MIKLPAPVAWIDAFGQPHRQRADAMVDEDSVPPSLHTADQLKQAIRDALEEAAKACEAMHEEDRPGDYAYSIRKLKEDIQ